MSNQNKIIVVGGGLAGLSAAHTVLEQGGRVLLLEKNAFCGGNSTKATSGINGALTRSQIKLGIQDSVESFLEDTVNSSKLGKPYDLAEVMCDESAPAIEWLIKAFNLDLSLVSRLGGHSFPRTHRGGERFPGMTITYALMEKFEEIAEKEPQRATLVSRARATELIKENGAVVGVKYIYKDKEHIEYGPVILSTGGYAADYAEDSLLKKYRPDVIKFPTTNGPHATGDGLKMAVKVGAALKDMELVQIHPTGLVHPDDPDNPTKFLAAEALRGVGGLMFDRDGKRFCNELGRRDYVSGEMMNHNKGPYYLVLNGKASTEIEWHCAHYVGRKLMQRASNGAELAKIMGVNTNVLKTTFDDYNKVADSKNDPYGKQYFHNGPWKLDDFFHVAVITPVRHYTMGGLNNNGKAQVLDANNNPVSGLFASGEIQGGTHGKNRLGGSSLLDCVVFGRVAGRSASSYLLDKLLSGGIQVSSQSTAAAAGAAPAAGDAAAAAPAGGLKVYTREEVAKHNKPDDCWVIIRGEVLDVTKFMHEHPGGAESILLFAGREATEEFDMIHKPDVIEKYAPETVVGVVKDSQAAAKL